MGIHLRSEGCDDPTKTPGTCGIAYMYIDGIDNSPHLRGHNVVVLDAKTGNVFSNNITLTTCVFAYPQRSCLSSILSCLHDDYDDNDDNDDDDGNDGLLRTVCLTVEIQCRSKGNISGGGGGGACERRRREALGGPENFGI